METLFRLTELLLIRCSFTFNSPGSKASREVANLFVRKNPHTRVYGVKEFVCRSVCQFVINFDPKFLRTGRTE